MLALRPSLIAFLLFAPSAGALDLELVEVNQVDILHLDIGGLQGMEFEPDTGLLWLIDGPFPGYWCGHGEAAGILVDPSTGAELTRFNPPAGTEAHFGSAREPQTGRLYIWGDVSWVFDETGVPLYMLAAPSPQSAAFTNARELWSSTAMPNGLTRLDPITGALLEHVPIDGLPTWVASLDRDPRTGRLIGIRNNGIVEIDLEARRVVGTTDFPPGSVGQRADGALALDEHGEHLFFAWPWWETNGCNDVNHRLRTYQRVLPGESLCFGDGSGAPCPCGNEGATGAGCANSTGAGARLYDAGTGSVSSDDLTLFGTRLIPGQAALLFSGDALASGGAGLPFGDGLRCADGAVKRLLTMTANAAGEALFGPGLSLLGDWDAGDARVFQAYYRDPSGSPCGSGFNTTHAVLVEFGA